MSRRREPDDADLFREAMRDVKPLAPSRAAPPTPHSQRTPADPQSPAVRAARRRRAAPGPTPAELPPPVIAPDADAPSHARPGAERGLRRLRRGEFPVEVSLDLHGLTAARAQQVLADFLAEAQARGTRCLRIVHGKGLRSGSAGPVLRPLVTAMLRSSPQVLAFTPAPAAQGGSGATHVLLRAGR